MGKGTTVTASLSAGTVAALLLFLLLHGSAGCNGLTGAGDLTSSDNADASSLADGAPSTTTPPSHGPDGAIETTPPIVVDPPKACPAVGRSCAPAPPSSDWVGPLIVYDNAAAADTLPPACPPEMVLARIDGHSGTPSGGVTCTKCGCGSVTGATCTSTLNQFTDLACDTTPTLMGLDGACRILTSTTQAIAVETTAHNGTCAVTGGVATKDAVKWPSNLRACGAPTLLADGCAPNQVCVPDAQPPFQKPLCILHAGTVPCPAPWTDVHMGATDVDDTRDCSKCACKPPQGVDCDGVARISPESPICATEGAMNQDLDLDCFPVPGASSVRIAMNGAITASGGFCPHDGSDSKPIGALAAKDPTTICCLQP